MSDPARFADAVNGFGCNGEQIVSATDLLEVDTQIRSTRLTGFVHKSMDYSLPVRNMLYDVSEYNKQISKIRKQVRESSRGLQPGEYLYGFRKEDKLYPVKHVLDFIRFSKNKIRLKELVEKEPYYQDMDEEAYDVISNYTDAVIIDKVKEKYIEEEGGRVNMCQALREWMQDERAEGKAEEKAEEYLKLFS